MQREEITDLLFDLLEKEAAKQDYLLELSQREGKIYVVDTDGVEWEITARFVRRQ